MSLDDPKNQKILSDFISEHAPFINKQLKSLRASGKIPEHVSDEDLHWHGVHGLIDAIHKYDHDVASRLSNKEGENPFLKYAGRRIKGKMLDHAASQDVVPKSLRNRAKNIAARDAQQQSSEAKSVTQDQTPAAAPQQGEPQPAPETPSEPEKQ